jgi:hypothetical protein
MDKIDEILCWEKTQEQRRDVRFVEFGQFLCEVRAGKYSSTSNSGLLPSKPSASEASSRRSRERHSVPASPSIDQLLSRKRACRGPWRRGLDFLPLCTSLAGYGGTVDLHKGTARRVFVRLSPTPFCQARICSNVNRPLLTSCLPSTSVKEIGFC